MIFVDIVVEIVLKDIFVSHIRRDIEDHHRPKSLDSLAIFQYRHPFLSSGRNTLTRSLFLDFCC